MTIYAPHCKQRNHDDRHADAAECDTYEAENRRMAVDDALYGISEAREALAFIRREVKDVERKLAEDIREALTNGGSVTKIARAAGLSRERVYQIRDSRR